ncbi:hypothetical protein EDD15DRAFT_2359540 [Pisolithus albus]|nr:hypothetical protein EDD15DRAFT_2359540 [Pisolithus albus]
MALGEEGHAKIRQDYKYQHLDTFIRKLLMSTAVSMTESDAHTLADFFNNSGCPPWVEGFAGPALSLPQEYREIELNGKLCVEYLQLDSTNGGALDANEGGPPNKNHVVFLVPFKKSLEVERDNEKPAIDKDRLENPYDGMAMGSDYYPGTLYVKLLRYDGRSLACNKFSTFTDLKFTTLGAFVDFLVDEKLHQMSLLRCSMAWKGCRDFMVEAVAGTDTNGDTLKRNITFVYSRNGDGKRKLIDCGKFLDYIHVIPDDIKDAYKPESTST